MGTEKFIIESLSEKDYPEAVAVYQDSRHFLVDISGENSSSVGMPTLIREIKEAEEHGGEVYGIRLKESGKMIGITSYVPKGYKGDQSRAWIALFMISENYQKSGYGKKAYALIEKTIFTDTDVSRIALGVLTNNQTGLIFWGKMGYRPTDTRSKDEHGHEIIVMEKNQS